MADARRRPLLMLLVTVPLSLVAALGGLLGWDWYKYVTAGEPYEEIGIDINSAMPGPIRRWGCAQIAARHPGTLPPHGCP